MTEMQFVAETTKIRLNLRVAKSVEIIFDCLESSDYQPFAMRVRAPARNYQYPE